MICDTTFMCQPLESLSNMVQDHSFVPVCTEGAFVDSKIPLTENECFWRKGGESTFYMESFNDGDEGTSSKRSMGRRYIPQVPID